MISEVLTVRDVMDPKPVSVSPQSSIQTVLSIMNQRRIGSVLVLDEQRRLVGIFTERDLLRRVASAVPGWRDYTVAEWMTSSPHVIQPNVGWEEAVTLMHQYRVRHLPVVEHDRVIGIISTRLLMSRREEYLNARIEQSTRELRAANDLLMARDEEQRYNLRTAGMLQARMLLPQQPPDWPEMRWAVHYEPLDHLGGDHYDFAQPIPGLLGFLIADASGHSIAAAMVAMFTRFAFIESANNPNPGEVLGGMNERLLMLTEERFVTAFYGVFNRERRTLRYAAAGHPSPLHYVAKQNQVIALSASGFLLGVMQDEQYIEKEVILQAGDKLCFYTDGIIEARNEIGELFGMERLLTCVQEYGHAPADDLIQFIMTTLKDFCGTEFFTDDVTLVVGEVLSV